MTIITLIHSCLLLRRNQRNLMWIKGEDMYNNKSYLVKNAVLIQNDMKIIQNPCWIRTSDLQFGSPRIILLTYSAMLIVYSTADIHISSNG
jgi:hypothetical protein